MSPGGIGLGSPPDGAAWRKRDSRQLGQLEDSDFAEHAVVRQGLDPSGVLR